MQMLRLTQTLGRLASPRARDALAIVFARALHDASARNGAIKARTVRIAAPGQPLSEPRRLSAVLASLDLAQSALVLVDGKQDPPICRVVDLAEESEKATLAREREKQHKADLRKKHLDLTISWVITEHDLGHKLGRVPELLARGGSLTLLIWGKSPSVTPSPAERRQIVARLVERITADGVARVDGEPLWQGSRTTIRFLGKKT